MSRKLACFIATVSVCGLFLAGCGGRAASGDGAPPPPKVEQETDVSLLQVEHPEQFPLVKAGESLQAPSLTVTGVLSLKMPLTTLMVSSTRAGSTMPSGRPLTCASSATASVSPLATAASMVG